MFFLPTEVQLDILKCLNFNQLFSVKQTNFYFYNLINKYEGELAKMKFYQLFLISHDFSCQSHPNKFIKLESGVFKFTLNDQLREKWQVAINKSIPLFFDKFGRKLLCMRTTVQNSRCYILKLPNIPKNIEEMIIVRCWLEQLFKCAFEYAHFYRNVFNPEIINILFDNNKTIPLQFQIQQANLYANNKTFENVLKFVSNNLSILGYIAINFDYVNITEKHTNILFNILINEGNKFPKIYLEGSKLARLYDPIMKHIITSKDCSKMVLSIVLDFSDSPNFKLSERAEKIEDYQVDDVKFTNYQISNIYNPKLQFSLCNEELIDDGSFLCFEIRKIKE